MGLTMIIYRMTVKKMRI